jgi:hypothetical protein
MSRDWTPSDQADAAEFAADRRAMRFPACRDTDESYCPRCGQPDPSPSVEAFETLDEVMCADCFSAFGEDDDQ